MTEEDGFFNFNSDFFNEHSTLPKQKKKIYKVDYILGVFDPVEYSIKIESVVDLTEKFIIDTIVEKRPTHKREYITNVLSVLLIKEEEI